MSTARSESRLLTMREAAEHLGVSPRFIRAAVHDRRLTALRLGRMVRIRHADLEEYLDRHTAAHSLTIDSTLNGER